jgi:hypothetical protein
MTTMNALRRVCLCLGGALMLTAAIGCGNSNNGGGGAGGSGGTSGAGGTGGAGGASVPADMGCYPKPTTSQQLLNGCTDAQTGDPAKDAPYFPALAPNGQLPPLN